MSFVSIYADVQSILKDIENEDLIIEIEQRLDGNSNFKREFIQSEEIQKAFDNF